ncbi:hypothetical protein T265_11284 [Opisthorchis viverrini]|uniref:Uncharacterized protein n=1 Tax=Opisthorchis viverrini TaxID=6198 RepID=A0A074YZI2_OPIVI|nr:hypothetical protein T265_11284 [Opisthorchis viverrini]KER20088.1 hypothetical protein T265_11284 [Opisthorchis viverrini]
MSDEHSTDLPPLDYFPPSPKRELPIDLKDRAAGLEVEMAKWSVELEDATLRMYPDNLIERSYRLR